MSPTATWIVVAWFLLVALFLGLIYIGSGRGG